jgi:hypothetical protein
MQTVSMSIEVWWPKLRPGTREWLIANNGDAVTASIMDEIEAVGGPAQADGWWVAGGDPDGFYLPDDAIDWIEEIANAETPAG